MRIFHKSKQEIQLLCIEVSVADARFARKITSHGNMALQCRLSIEHQLNLKNYPLANTTVRLAVNSGKI